MSIKTRAEFTKKFRKEYNWLNNNNKLYLLDKFFKRNKKEKWTLETCKKEALKYKTRTAWQKGFRSSYTAALRNGWLDECCKHMEVKCKSWTLTECKEEALKYKTRTAWQKGFPNSYAAALRNGWLEECCKHMEVKCKSWTLETCKKEALKYSSKSEWAINSGSSYNKARKRGWLEECCEHMKANKYVGRKVKNLDTGQFFDSIANACKKHNINSGSLCRAIKKGQKAGGYRWAYVEENC